MGTRPFVLIPWQTQMQTKKPTTSPFTLFMLSCLLTPCTSLQCIQLCFSGSSSCSIKISFNIHILLTSLKMFFSQPIAACHPRSDEEDRAGLSNYLYLQATLLAYLISALGPECPSCSLAKLPTVNDVPYSHKPNTMVAICIYLSARLQLCWISQRACQTSEKCAGT